MALAIFFKQQRLELRISEPLMRRIMSRRLVFFELTQFDPQIIVCCSSHLGVVVVNVASSYHAIRSPKCAQKEVIFFTNLKTQEKRPQITFWMDPSMYGQVSCKSTLRLFPMRDSNFFHCYAATLQVIWWTRELRLWNFVNHNRWKRYSSKIKRENVVTQLGWQHAVQHLCHRIANSRK